MDEIVFLRPEKIDINRGAISLQTTGNFPFTSLFDQEKKNIQTNFFSGQQHIIFIGLGECGLAIANQLQKKNIDQSIESLFFSQHRSLLNLQDNPPTASTLKSNFSMLTLGWSELSIRGLHYKLDWQSPPKVWRKFANDMQLSLPRNHWVFTPSVVYTAWLYHLQHKHLLSFLQSWLRDIHLQPSLHIACDLASCWPILIPEIHKTLQYILGKSVPLYVHLILPSPLAPKANHAIAEYYEIQQYGLLKKLYEYNTQTVYTLFSLLSECVDCPFIPDPIGLITDFIHAFIHGQDAGLNNIFSFCGIANYTQKKPSIPQNIQIANGEFISSEELRKMENHLRRWILQNSLESEAVAMETITTEKFVFQYAKKKSKSQQVWEGLLSWQLGERHIHDKKITNDQIPPQKIVDSCCIIQNMR